MPDTSSYLPVPDDVVAARATILRDLGIATVKAFPALRHCSGYMAPPGHRRTDGCPDVSYSVMAFDRAELASGQEAWQLKMIGIGYNPTGRVVTTYRVFVVQREGMWVFDRAVPLVLFD